MIEVKTSKISMHVLPAIQNGLFSNYTKGHPNIQVKGRELEIKL